MKFLPPKLMDSKRHGRGTELFIVEGDSAARTVQRVRDASFQAVLPMQGKPMNTTRASLKSLQENVQFGVLLRSLGAQVIENDNHGEYFPDQELLFDRIILLFDPDADGIHARTLMLLFFHRWMPFLLKAGRVFDTHAPQWALTGAELESPIYAATPDHMRAIRGDLQDQGVTDLQWQRFQGLGNIDGEILETQCVDPATRQLLTLNSKNAEQAIQIFEEMRALGHDS